MLDCGCQTLAWEVEGVVNLAPPLASGQRRLVLEQQRALVERNALRLTWLAGPEPGPALVGLGFGRKTDDITVEARRSSNVFHDQDNLGKTNTKHCIFSSSIALAEALEAPKAARFIKLVG